jgi:hypothetical protein
MAGLIFAFFVKNPAKMNSRINLTTDFIHGYSHFALPGQFVRSGEMHPSGLIFKKNKGAGDSIFDRDIK